MSAQRADGYARAFVEVARAEGRLDDVVDELFRFARTLESSEALRDTLVDQLIPLERRQAIVEDLLGGRASDVTTSLVSFVVGAGRGRDLPAIADRVVALAAHERDQEVAEVRSAIPLSDDQRQRLADALSRATGKRIDVRVIVDPSVMGGLVAQVGDTVIDGSVRRRIDQLRELL
ncbi:MAG: ATP synthase F1 subunit delta [Acidimicrobiales bacterium]|nr:ATP synthase F1 subunit delta [Acidimicrobiales bacterium]